MRTSRVLGVAAVLCTISSALLAQGGRRRFGLIYGTRLDREGVVGRSSSLGDGRRQSGPRVWGWEGGSAAGFGFPCAPGERLRVPRRATRLDVSLGDNAAGGD